MEKFDIYEIEFIYQEDKLKDNPRTKKRPVLLLGNDLFIPVVKITGTFNPLSTTYEIKNWKESGLDKPSYIVFNRKELQLKSGIKSENYKGHLSEEDIQEIKSRKLVESLCLNENLSFKCPHCGNNELRCIEHEVNIPADVDFHEIFICDECGSEYLSEPQYDGKIKFKTYYESDL